MNRDQKGLGVVPILAILLAIAVMAGAGYFVLMRGNKTVNNAVGSVVSSAESKKIFDDCKKEYQDEDLCKALSNFTANTKYQTTITSTDSNAMSISMEVDGDKTYTKQTVSGKTLEMIIASGATYTKDNTDGKWWKQINTSTQTSLSDELKFDTNISETTTKTTYTKVGQEACDKLTCIKYKVTETGSKDIQHIWIDTKDHLLRKWTTESADGSKSEVKFSYDKKSVELPKNTKDASPTQSVIPADFYSGMTSTGTTTNSSSDTQMDDNPSQSDMTADDSSESTELE